MAKINVTKRGKFYQYRFQLAAQMVFKKWLQDQERSGSCRH